MNRAGIESLLPFNFRRAVQPQGPLSALLDVMEAMHAPSEEVSSGSPSRLLASSSSQREGEADLSAPASA